MRHASYVMHYTHAVGRLLTAVCPMSATDDADRMACCFVARPVLGGLPYVADQ